MDISTNIKDIIPSLSKAIALARRETSVLVYEAVQLEGINMTLPEIQTLLDGVTVGGQINNIGHPDLIDYNAIGS